MTVERNPVIGYLHHGYLENPPDVDLTATQQRRLRLFHGVAVNLAIGSVMDICREPGTRAIPAPETEVAMDRNTPDRLQGWWPLRAKMADGSQLSDNRIADLRLKVAQIGMTPKLYKDMLTGQKRGEQHENTLVELAYGLDFVNPLGVLAAGPALSRPTNVGEDPEESREMPERLSELLRVWEEPPSL